MSMVCFHNPDEENGYLSNWYLSEFECDGIRFSSMEQYMIVVYNGLCAKFQNSELKSKLKATGDAVLAEGAVRDCIWGIGLSMTDPKRLEMEKWRGQNLLGFSLMMVRDEI